MWSTHNLPKAFWALATALFVVFTTPNMLTSMEVPGRPALEIAPALVMTTSAVECPPGTVYDSTVSNCIGEWLVTAGACAICASGNPAGCLACAGAIINYCECLDDVYHEEDEAPPPPGENHGCFEDF